MEVDLQTTYLGLSLRNPLIVAACPLTRENYLLEQLEQAGASAAVMYSMFAEQVERDRLLHVGQDSGTAGCLDAAPLPHEYVSGLDAYLKHIELAKKSVSMPIIGSLNA